MWNRKTIYIALFLILAGFGLKTHATLPDSRQYIIQLEENTLQNDVAEAAGHGSVLIMVSPAGESVQFTATLTNTGARCDLSLFTITDTGESQAIATLNPNTFKVERAGETDSRVHLAGTLSQDDLSGQLQTDSLEEFCQLLRDSNIYLKANISSEKQKALTG